MVVPVLIQTTATIPANKAPLPCPNLGLLPIPKALPPSGSVQGNHACPASTNPRTPTQHHNQTSSPNNPDCPSAPSPSELPHNAAVVTCNKIPVHGIDTINPFSILEHCTLIDPSSFMVDRSPQDLNQPLDLSQPNSQATVKQVTARPSRSLKTGHHNWANYKAHI